MHIIYYGIGTQRTINSHWPSLSVIPKEELYNKFIYGDIRAVVSIFICDNISDT